MITPEYPAKIHVRSKLHYFPLIKDRINEARRSLFRTTCFGPWLDISYVENDDGMIHYVLQKQSFSDDESFDLPFIYHLNGHSLHFGRRQFCLVTGFKFGLISLREHRNGDIPFRNRLFPKKIGYDVKIIDVLAFIEDEEKFSKLVSVVDDAFFRIVNYLDAWNSFPWGEHIWRQLYDSIRNVCSKHKLEHLDGLRKNPNHVPSYTLSGFLFCFQDMESNWSISLNVLSGSISLSFLTRSPPVSIGGLYGEYLNKRSALPAKKQKEIDESKREYDLSGRDMTLKGKCFEKEERFKKFSPKNEDLLHSTSEDEPNNKDDISPKKDAADVYCCDVNSDVSQCFIPANILVEKADCESEIQRLYKLREARLNKIAEEDKQRKFIRHMNLSASMKLAIERCVPKKRKFVDVMRSPYTGLSTTLNVPSMEELANQKNVLNPVMIGKCKSVKPWIE
ncbi:hypothetical protein Tco_0996002, partial [Tanacetum coccineum]